MANKIVAHIRRLGAGPSPAETASAEAAEGNYHHLRPDSSLKTVIARCRSKSRGPHSRSRRKHGTAKTTGTGETGESAQNNDGRSKRNDDDTEERDGDDLDDGQCSHSGSTTALTGNVYIEEVPSDIEPARRLLEKYSGIKRKDIEPHIHEIRDKLWSIYPYACVGHFRFLSLCFTSDPRYKRALRNLLAPAPKFTLLDVGCCVGQMLRQLAFDGVDSRQLYGLDVEPRFVELGYQLFRDRDKLKASFVTGDVTASDDSSDSETFRSLEGSMDMIHATSFFHLFSWEAQVKAAKQLVRLLKPPEQNPDVMIFGRHVGTMRPGPESERSAAHKSYLHDGESWQALWDEVGRATGTSWRTEVEVYGGPTGDADGNLCRVQFGVYRA